ncbi:protein arginine N-methyltransferase 2 [Dendrobium catenatum]|uniref:Protein arginine N-methyltransferase 2 n=1 Tax=Dendrobium catenatum TaxID=906689 RepID=A0A2I0X5V6_9ASPA|nr:protein arginine N-methyltransferase 2 [Dendrobium catenatum]PKU83292.1 Potassium channel AKT2/3 [Dendrobium catenatum]
MEKPSEELLCAAAIVGDCARLRDLLLAGADASFFDSDGMTPLMHAAAGGHADAVRCLLDAGAPWNALSPSNLSAGDLAMENAHQEVFDILLNFAIQAELVLGTIARRGRGEGTASHEEYMSERVAFGEDRIMDAKSEAVMMAWEKPLMEAHARAICCSGDDCGRILNVGFGMGLVDEAIQRYKPLEHTIVEAHPDVYDRMIRTGWGEKENVKIVFGKWQDVLPQLGSFDGIFFDTFGEYYEDMREFHKHLYRLLKPGGIYSYFNGFCGSNAFFHVVYCQLVALELGDLGYSTQFIPLPVKECLSENIWKGVKHKYWQLDTYNLPVCQASHDSE